MCLYSMYYICYNRFMSTKNIEQLLAQRKALLKELSTLTHLIRGSSFKRYSTCSRENCDCHTGKRHGPRYYLVIHEKGRQRQKYLPAAQVPHVVDGIEQYHRLQEIVEEITQINLALIKEKAYGKS
jgi:hypothetical protein